MAITSIIFFEVARTLWKWPLWRTLPLLALFLSVELPFFASNIFKIVEGGYVPILVGAFLFVIMLTWKHGDASTPIIWNALALPLDTFLHTLEEQCSIRVPVTGVFLTANQRSVPRIVHNMVTRMKCLPATWSYSLSRCFTSPTPPRHVDFRESR